MKIQSMIKMIVLVSMLLMQGCAAPATQSAANQQTRQSKQNTKVVLNMVKRLNAGDVEGSLAYFADDAVFYLMGLPSTGIEMYKGKEQIRYVWQDSADNNFKWEVQIESTYGDIVNVQSKTWHDFTRQLEVAPLHWRDVYQVVDGKIKTYGSWLTEESLARFKPAFTAAIPPEPTAKPFSGTPGSELTVTIARGTCTTDAPLALKAGDVKVNWIIQDQDKSKYALTLFTLDADKDILDLMVATYGTPPSWGDMMLYDELGPGASKTYSIKLENGPLYLICWSKPPDLPIGNSGPILVVK